MLGTVAALREALITSDMTALAGFTSLSGFGMARLCVLVDKPLSVTITMHGQTHLRRGGPPPGPAIDKT